jgi:hypothetical protein
MSGKARRAPLASLQANHVRPDEQHAESPAQPAKGKAPPKSRLAMLKDENARFCAPKTRIPTPAATRRAPAGGAAGSFASKIPLPSPRLLDTRPVPDLQAPLHAKTPARLTRHPAGTGGPARPDSAGGATPIAQGEAGSPSTPEFGSIAAEALQLSRELSASPAGSSEDAQSTEAMQGTATGAQEPRSRDGGGAIAGHGTPQDFSAVFDMAAVGRATQEGYDDLTPGGSSALAPSCLLHASSLHEGNVPGI